MPLFPVFPDESKERESANTVTPRSLKFFSNSKAASAKRPYFFTFSIILLLVSSISFCATICEVFGACVSNLTRSISILFAKMIISR